MSRENTRRLIFRSDPDFPNRSVPPNGERPFGPDATLGNHALKPSDIRHGRAVHPNHTIGGTKSGSPGRAFPLNRLHGDAGAAALFQWNGPNMKAEPGRFDRLPFQNRLDERTGHVDRDGETDAVP